MPLDAIRVGRVALVHVMPEFEHLGRVASLSVQRVEERTEERLHSLRRGYGETSVEAINATYKTFEKRLRSPPRLDAASILSRSVRTISSSSPAISRSISKVRLATSTFPSSSAIWI